jgi:hypothetical protein
MERLVSASLAELLAKVGPSIAAGVVNVISVEGIRERSDARWPRKREQVVAFVERAFSRLCQAGDLICPLNDTEFLTIQPNSSRTAALGLSANVLKETLEFFLGEAAPQDIRLFQVTSFVNGELAVQAVAPGRLTDAGHDDPWTGRREAPAAPPMAELTRLAHPHRVTLSIAPWGPVEVTLSVEPVWNAAERAVVSYAVQPTVRFPVSADEQPGLPLDEMSPTLAAEIALVVIKRGAELLQSLSARIALHLPLPLRALTYSTARYRVLRALQDLPAELRKLVVLDVVELSPGLPPGRLTEVVSTIAPYGRAVLGRAEAETARVTAWRGCGLNGVSVDCSHLCSDDRQALAKLSRFVRDAQTVARPCVAYGLTSRALVMTAWAAGCTHLSGPAVSMHVLPHPGPVRFQPLDLFAADLRGATPVDTAATPHPEKESNR